MTSCCWCRTMRAVDGKVCPKAAPLDESTSLRPRVLREARGDAQGVRHGICLMVAPMPLWENRQTSVGGLQILMKYLQKLGSSAQFL